MMAKSLASVLTLTVLLFPCPSLALHARNSVGRSQLPEGVKPLLWLHTPKCGSSFVNTLFHHPEICPKMPSKDYVQKGEMVHIFVQSHRIPKLCPHGLMQNFGHAGVGQVFDQYKDHIVGFFRQPEQRIISAYFHEQNGWYHKKPAKDVREFAEGVAGCQVQMITRGDLKHNVCGIPPHPMIFEVESAVQRVNQLKFVGITDEWDLSICLFHKIYGGPCTDADFANMRPGSRANMSGTERLSYNAEEILPNFTDKYDGPLFDAALGRFWQLVEQNDVTRGSCEELCANATELKPFALLLDPAEAPAPFSLGKKTTTGGDDPFAYDWPGRAAYDTD